VGDVKGGSCYCPHGKGKEEMREKKVVQKDNRFGKKYLEERAGKG